MEKINSYIEDGYIVTVYSNGSVDRQIISELPAVEQPILLSTEEMQMQTLLNTEYLVIMSELTNI